MAELTKFGVNSNIRIPPESTGNKVYHHVHINVSVSGLIPPTQNLPWAFTTDSGVAGFVTSIGPITGSINQRLTLLLNSSSSKNTVEPSEIITIIHEDINVTCTVVAVEPVYTPAITIAGGDSPDNFLNIDKAGSAFVRFTEGEQQLDPKGMTRFSSPTTIMDTKFLGGTNDSMAFAKITGTASQTNSSVERILFMDVGADTGDRIVKRTNRSAFFQGGFSSIFETAIAIGDNGKTNVVRRWGYYDDLDGLFFELDGETLYVVLRSSVSGAVVEERVAQSQWNTDKLDGSNTVENLSGIDLNYSFMNYYYIDFPGSAAGRVRFGIYGPSGRVVCHQFYYGNNRPNSFMRTASLPMTWEQFNKGPSPSPSRMKTIGGTVMNEGFQTPESQITIAANYTWLMPTPATATGSDWKYILSARAAKFVPGTGDTVPNRKATIPQKLSYHVTGGPVVLQIRAGLVPAGSPAYTQAAFGSVAEVDVSGEYPASPLLQGMPLLTRMYAAGQHTVDPPQSFNYRGSGLTTRSDGEYGIVYSFVFKPLNPSDNVSVTVALDWVDV